jgi:hypothetical protein
MFINVERMVLNHGLGNGGEQPKHVLFKILRAGQQIEHHAGGSLTRHIHQPQRHFVYAVLAAVQAQRLLILGVHRFLRRRLHQLFVALFIQIALLIIGLILRLLLYQLIVQAGGRIHIAGDAQARRSERVGFCLQPLARRFLPLHLAGGLVFAFGQQPPVIQRFQLLAGLLLFAYRRLPRSVLFRELLKQLLILLLLLFSSTLICL